MRSTEVRDVQHLSLFRGPHPDSIMDAESTITVNILLYFLRNTFREMKMLKGTCF